MRPSWHMESADVLVARTLAGLADIRLPRVLLPPAAAARHGPVAQAGRCV